ncbi:MAG: class I SAM-dependent methyltransferase [Planctomycetes bacterium]|nr:class I SAM-dependent methyltransferase [Planctomycetota bacterium]
MINPAYAQVAPAIDPGQRTSQTLTLARIRPGSRVLEFGPSTGYMTKWMKERLNCCVTAVEIDAAAARECAPYCERILVADADRLDFEGAFPEGSQFDAILFADVLEHLCDPGRVTRACKRLLRRDGSVVASVPNVSHAAVVVQLLMNRFEYRQTGLLDRTHLRFFTRDSILERFALDGYKVVFLDTLKTSARDTEFGIDLAPLHPALIEILRRNPDSETYQFVIEAKKAEDVSGPGLIAGQGEDMWRKLTAPVDPEEEHVRLRAEVDRLRGELSACREGELRLKAIENSKSYRVMRHLVTLFRALVPRSGRG